MAKMPFECHTTSVQLFCGGSQPHERVLQQTNFLVQIFIPYEFSKVWGAIDSRKFKKKHILKRLHGGYICNFTLNYDGTVLCYGLNMLNNSRVEIWKSFWVSSQTDGSWKKSHWPNGLTCGKWKKSSISNKWTPYQSNLLDPLRQSETNSYLLLNSKMSAKKTGQHSAPSYLISIWTSSLTWEYVEESSRLSSYSSDE